MKPAEYNAAIVLGCSHLELIESGTSEDESIRLLDVRLDGRLLGQARLLASLFPSFAIREAESAELLIWTATRVYIIRVKENQFSFYEHSDAVHAAYGIERLWCLVGDTSVVLVDIWEGSEFLRYDHDEIFMTSYWEGNNLLVRDLQNRAFRFDNLKTRQEILRPQAVMVG